MYKKKEVTLKTNKLSHRTLKTLNGRGQHPASKSNLKKWKKGQSGNPGGRPLKFSKISKILNQYGQKRDIKYVWDNHANKYVTVESELTYKEEVLNVVWEQAKGGSLRHIELLAALGCLDKK